jgi:CrcB protein
VITALAFLGAAVAGSLLRATTLVRLNRPTTFPVGTLLVNISGSFALGWASHLSPPAITVIGVGALGAYTTFSTFALDAVHLAEERRPFTAAGYVVATLVTCLLAAAAGLALA